jgi:hypothetical protein
MVFRGWRPVRQAALFSMTPSSTWNSTIPSPATSWTMELRIVTSRARTRGSDRADPWTMMPAHWVVSKAVTPSTTTSANVWSPPPAAMTRRPELLVSGSPVTPWMTTLRIRKCSSRPRSPEMWMP